MSSHPNSSRTTDIGCLGLLWRATLGIAVLSLLAIIGLSLMFQGWSIGGRTDPVYLEVLELEEEAHAAELRGDFNQAISIYRRAIIRSADGKRGPLENQRAACNLALAGIYESRGEWATALRHYEASNEDRRRSGYFGNVIRCRVELYGVGDLDEWIRVKEPRLFQIAEYLEVQEYFIEHGHAELATKNAIAFLGAVRLPDDVRLLLDEELETSESSPKKTWSNRSKQHALDTLAWAQLELVDHAAAKRAAEAAISFAERHGGIPRSELFPSGKFDKRSAIGRAVLARIALDSGDEEAWRDLRNEALSADTAVGRLPILSRPTGQRFPQSTQD